MISVCFYGSCLPEFQASEDAAHLLPSSDPTAHLLPNKVKDFMAFINLVDFCRWQRHNMHINNPPRDENEQTHIGYSTLVFAKNIYICRPRSIWRLSVLYGYIQIQLNIVFSVPATAVSCCWLNMWSIFSPGCIPWAMNLFSAPYEIHLSVAFTSCCRSPWQLPRESSTTR